MKKLWKTRLCHRIGIERTASLNLISVMKPSFVTTVLRTEILLPASAYMKPTHLNATSIRINATESNFETGIDLERVTPYSGLKKRRRRMAGMPPKRTGFKTAHETTGMSTNCNKQESLDDAVSYVIPPRGEKQWRKK